MPPENPDADGVPHDAHYPVEADPDPDPAEELLYLDDELAELLAASAADAVGGAGGVGPDGAVGDIGDTADVPRPSAPPSSHRRPPRLLSKQNWLRGASIGLALLTSVVVIAVSVFGAVVSYSPLEHAAAQAAPPEVARCWPLLIFAPWLVAYFTILRATLHRRRAVRAWLLVVFCVALAAALCVSEAPQTLTGVLVSGLPPVAALACFAQHMGQLSLTRPPRSHRTPPAHRHRPDPGNGGGGGGVKEL
ncbi:DUF2637 domain-containing protein [Streptomyces sp. ODS28]|uniref:DUF2637 domain-containing protein n=1 Tax=Streptomyces sp. ODS28 TaxID=3136688 RepID=UPI0031EE7F66